MRKSTPRLVFGQRTVEPRHEAQRVQKTKPLAVGINEAAKLTRLSPWTIRAYVARGMIRSVRFGKRVLIPMEALRRATVEGLPRKGEEQ